MQALTRRLRGLSERPFRGRSATIHLPKGITQGITEGITSELPKRYHRQVIVSPCKIKTYKVETKGLEPSTSALRTQQPQVASGKVKRVTARQSAVCTSVCTSDAKSGHGNCSEPAVTDGFAAAVQAIMTLPLSDAEKAEAVRRLLARR
jgi:hypothetical protein